MTTIKILKKKIGCVFKQFIKTSNKIEKWEIKKKKLQLPAETLIQILSSVETKNDFFTRINLKKILNWHTVNSPAENVEQVEDLDIRVRFCSYKLLLEVFVFLDLVHIISFGANFAPVRWWTRQCEELAFAQLRLNRHWTSQIPWCDFYQGSDFVSIISF